MTKKQTQEEQPQEAQFRSGGHMFATTPYENGEEAQPEEPQTDEADESEE
jgi:hypothetical protein